MMEYNFSSSKKYKLSLSIYCISLIILVLFIATTTFIYATPQDHDVSIRLDIGGIFTEANSDKLFVASNLPTDTVVSIVPTDVNQQDLSFGNNYIAYNGTFDSKVYLVYTKGTIATIDARMSYVRDNTFEHMSNPSFGFPMTGKQKVYVGLDYGDIDYSNYDYFGVGIHNLIFKNQGTIDKKSILSIEKK